jgi:hypothetical protein
MAGDSNGPLRLLSVWDSNGPLRLLHPLNLNRGFRKWGVIAELNGEFGVGKTRKRYRNKTFTALAFQFNAPNS